MDYAQSVKSAARCSAEQLSSLIRNNKKLKKNRKNGIIPVFLIKKYVFSSGDSLSEDLFIPEWDKFLPEFASSLKKDNEVYSSLKEKDATEKKLQKKGQKTAQHEITAYISSSYYGKNNESIRYSVKTVICETDSGRQSVSQKASFLAKNQMHELKDYQIDFPKRTEKNYFASLQNPKPKLDSVPASTRTVKLSEIPSIPLEVPASMEAPAPLTYEKLEPEEKLDEELCDFGQENCDMRKIYGKGLMRYGDGLYLQALRIFTFLGDFAYSMQYAQSSYYNYAAQLHNQGNYEEALRLLSSIPNYAKAKERIVLLKYNVGLKKLYSSPPDYEGAIHYLAQVEGFKNSRIYLDEARTLKYNSASLLNKKRHYDEAEKLFKELGRYKDSQSRAKEAFYNGAKQEYLEKKYDSALNKFRALGKYQESKAFVKDILDIKYNLAVKKYNSKKYEEAASSFAEISEHLDSRICENYSNYAQAITHLRAKEYEKAFPILKKLKDFGQSRKFAADIASLKSLVPYEEGSILEFGSYMGMPLRWKVMRKDYESLLLLCEDGIEVRKFDAKSPFWEKSALRAWLNGNFIKGWKEKDREALISFSKNGERAADRIFVLNEGESVSLFKDGKARMSAASSEAAKSPDMRKKAKTAGKPPEEKYYAWQWLRDPGIVRGRVAAVSPEGVIMFSGIAPDSAGITARPAAWVKAEAFRQK